MSDRLVPAAGPRAHAVAAEPARLAWSAVALLLFAAVVTAPLWSADAARSPGLVAGAALILAAVAALLFLRVARQARAQAQTLDHFTSALRGGDVGAALRALHLEAPSSVLPKGATPSEQPDLPGGASRFDRAARDVEVALGERERRWQARMRLSADWHWETDERLRFSWVSQDLASLGKLGVQPADLLGHRLDEVVLFQAPEGGWEPVMARLQQHRALRELTLEVHRRGRSPVWVVLNARPYTDEKGRFVGYEGVGRDVTEQRLAHLRLAESERRHAMMAELAADWYWQTDVEHRIQEIGPVALSLAGERANQIVGHTRWELYSNGASDAEWDAHRADLEARRPFRSFEFALRHTGRGLRWVAVSGVPRFDAKGEFIGYHGVGRDITLKKRAERMLLTRNEQLERLVAARTTELEQSNRDLEAFARQLAHELRTPIGQVVGLADLLKSRAWERLTDDEREWLHLAGQAAREMSHTVTALLELARSASTALLLEPVDLSALAEAVIADLPWLERKAPVDWHVEPGLSAHCGAALARVVLMNLLGNAAKFTRDVAAPRIEFTRDASDVDGGFMVRDNGAGFDAERGASLFQPFVRLHRSDQFQGTGLGLSIVRRIIERHGGSVAAFGEPGQGASFHFRFAAPSAAPNSTFGGDSTLSMTGTMAA